jgi:hypothetical protein
MDGELARIAALQGGFVYRWQALDCGYREAEVARLLRLRDWVAPRRGAYVLGAAYREMSPSQRYALLVRIVVGGLTGQVVVANYSALALRDVPLWGVDLAKVHVYRDDGRTSRTDAGVVHHVGAPADRDVEVSDGVMLCRPELALADAGRTVSFEAGVVLGDAVLRHLSPDVQRLHQIVRDDERDWPGAVTAGRVIGFADPRAETVGESRSRVMLARIGLPAPDLQKVFCRPDGEIYARTDFWIEAHQTVGEFDGKVKYGRALYEQSGDLGDVDLGAVLFAEKRREDDIRTDGAEVVRWTWSELDGHDRTIRGRFEAAFARAARRRPAG